MDRPSAPESPTSDDRRRAGGDDPLADVVNLHGFEAKARERLEPAAFDFLCAGAGDEISLRRNVESLTRWQLLPRVLRDVSAVDTGTTLLGTPVAMPVGLAPAALQRHAHPDGELASSRAAARANVLFCLSTWSACSLEEVALGSIGPRWFQLYVTGDRGFIKELVLRAASTGYQAIVLTVDYPVSGYRDRDLQNRFVPLSPFTELSVAAVHDARLTWEDLDWVSGLADLPLVLKGILTPEDARLAVEHGASAIVASNHGGRQLDRSPAPTEVLGEIVAAVGPGVEVYVDGGFRRGSDVIVALALGARGVFIGRPYLYALAAGGEVGVGRALSLMQTELENAMALLGVRRVEEISPHHVRRAPL